ncbi:Vacuolar protein sorting-associated protein 70 [Spathaspora sp. JA1]|nr:Vacuolar protein sorting-associated protein 70 [Spathaspora sp. JA1]
MTDNTEDTGSVQNPDSEFTPLLTSSKGSNSSHGGLDEGLDLSSSQETAGSLKPQEYQVTTESQTYNSQEDQEEEEDDDDDNRSIVAYINIDGDAVMGSKFSVDSNPMLNSLLRNTAKFIPIPKEATSYKTLKNEDDDDDDDDDEGYTTLHRYWMKQDNTTINPIMGLPIDQTESVIFQQHLGTPSINIKFENDAKRDSSVYVPNSNYYSRSWLVKREIDDDLLLHGSMIRFIGLLAISLSEHEVVSYKTHAYFKDIEGFFNDLVEDKKNTLGFWHNEPVSNYVIGKTSIYQDLGIDDVKFGDLLRQFKYLMNETVYQSGIFDEYNNHVEDMLMLDYPWYLYYKKLQHFAQFKVSNYKLSHLERDLKLNDRDYQYLNKAEKSYYNSIIYEIAWMLATLGPKVSKIKTKREINNVSIPKLYRLKQTKAFRMLLDTPGTCFDTFIPSKPTHHLQDVNIIESYLKNFWVDEDDPRPNKKRRLELTNDDPWEISGTQSTSNESQIEQIEQIEQDNIDQLMGRLEVDNSMEVDIDFNLDCNPVPEQEQVQLPEIQQGADIENLIDDLILQTSNEANQENHASISNDPNFHLSTTNNLQTIDESHESSFLPLQKMRIDQETILTREQMLKAVEEYEPKMLAKQNKELGSDAQRFDDIIQAMNFDFSVYSDYVYRSIFQNQYRSGKQLRRNSFLDTSLGLTNRTILLNEESEHARRASRENVQEEPEFDLNMDNFQPPDMEIPRSQEEIFNISFGNAFRNSSRVPTDRSAVSTLSDISTSNQTIFGRQLRKFFKYTIDRSQALGTKFISSEYGLNTLTESSEFSALKTNVEYYCIPFSDLVPNNSSAKELDELPMRRKHAANSFSNVLNLASKNLLVIDALPSRSFEMLSASSINIIVQGQENENENEHEHENESEEQS